MPSARRADVVMADDARKQNLHTTSHTILVGQLRPAGEQEAQQVLAHASEEDLVPSENALRLQV